MYLKKTKLSNEISLVKSGELNERNVERNVGRIDERIDERIDGESNKKNIFVKNSIDYSSYEPSHIESEGENKSLSDLEDNDLDELAILGFFNDFTLMDIGIHDLIREVYFED